MKKFNKEKFIKKVNKIYQLEDELKNLRSNLQDMHNEIDVESKILANNQTKYNELIDTPIKEIKNYSDFQFEELEELMDTLKSSPKKIEKLKNKKAKVFRKYQAIQNKIHKLRNSR